MAYLLGQFSLCEKATDFSCRSVTDRNLSFSRARRMARGRLGDEERETYERKRTMSPRLSERHCGGHRCPSRHTLCWLHPACTGLLNPFFHSLSETLFIFLLSLSGRRRRVTRTELDGKEEKNRPLARAAPHQVISLKSNCTRKNGTPLSGKRIARRGAGVSWVEHLV